MDKAEKLLEIQVDIYDKIQKGLTNYKKTPKDRISVAYIQSRLETLESNWSKFEQNHEQLITLVGKEDRKLLNYFSEDAYYTCEELYYSYKGELKTLLIKVTPIPPRVEKEQIITQRPSTSEVKLPRIAIPTFSGNYTEWQSFHDLFSALIHRNEGLEDVQKLQYLKSNLTGEAESLLKQFGITGDNYAEAWTVLKKRDDNKRYIANSIFKKFFNQRTINQESPLALKQLLDTSTECLNSLKNLGLPTSQWDAIVIYIIVSKLDPESHKHWEETINRESTDAIPVFSQLQQFLETRFRTLEMVENSHKGVKLVKSKAFHVSADVQCAFCKDNHYIYNCKQFSKQPVQERYDFVQKNYLCFNCLTPGHSVYRCKQLTKCKICQRKHHSLLHLDRRRSEDTTTRESTHKDHEEELKAHLSRKIHPGQNVLLATALVNVRGENGKSHVFRALVDPGSQASFVTERVVQMLGLQKTKYNGVVSGIGEGENKLYIKSIVNFELRSRVETTFALQVQAYVLKTLTGTLPIKKVRSINWPQMRDKKLADPTFSTPGRIDVLIGADLYSKIIDSGLVKSPEGIVAQSTHLGWIISGDLTDALDTKDTSQPSFRSMHVTVLNNDMLKLFWEEQTNDFTCERVYTKEEEQCEEIFRKTTTRDETGRYIVHLPLKKSLEDTIKTCGNTKKIATTRFHQLEKRFERNQSLKAEYTRVIKEYLEMGHMCRTNDDEGSIYLPHHAVINETKDTTKVRVVYNASEKGSNGYSLNETMMVGPTIQPDLRTLITRWRTHKICVVGDIIKMYRQIKVTDLHTNLQQIVWRDDSSYDLQSFKLLTVTFGTAAAPFLAVRTLHQLAEDEGHKYPEAAEAVKHSFYMDDLMSGGVDIDQTKALCKDINQMLKLGGFEMQKWSSNSEELLDTLRGDQKSAPDKLEIKWDQVIKILGLTWDRRDDKFKFTVQLPDIVYPMTKRSVLSDVARLFDPFGWLSPVVVTAKIMIQKLWLCSLGWDDEPPPALIEEWMTYRNDLNHLSTLLIPRWLTTTPDSKEVVLHGFADASTAAYAAVVYLKVTDKNGEVQVSLLASKTKVAPLKQLSVPRLELCAAVLLARMLTDMMKVLDIPKNKIFAWTDSMVVLSWLQSQPSRWQTFVANRVSEIIQRIDNDCWRHVKSEQNPADLASRGISSQELGDKEIWWTGPSWLRETNSQTEYDRCLILKTDLEIKKTGGVQVGHTKINEVPIWERFSDLTRMKRVLAYCKRFIERVNKNETTRDGKNETRYLSTEELDWVLERCILEYQQQEFKEDLRDLRSTKEVKKTSKLSPLTPFLDKNGVMRVQGRLENAQMTYGSIHPIIMSGKEHLTRLLVKDAHLKTLHGGIQLTLAFLRTKYWIIGVKNIVKTFIRKCVICIRHRAQAQQQLMGQLPSSRVNPLRPFKNCGVDYAGPIQIRMSKGRGYKSTKGYICLFICMSIKAIHLEAVTDLSTQGFMAAFRRFVARRGRCSNIWSDNGTNFVGAAKELRRLFDGTQTSLSREIAELLANDGTKWHFIPPRAPNFGGLWEAGVKSTKIHLNRIIGTNTLTYEEMSTLLAQIEACLNSRPICQLEHTIDSLIPLTPGHFLIGEPLISVPEKWHESNPNPLDRWHLLQSMTQTFWKRWQSEYLHTMQQRYKWKKVLESPEIGDIVIIKEDEVPPAKWLLGKVVALHPGLDKLVRVVTVQCKGGNILKRPISKLVRLPTTPEE